jgi:hypothetical protein
MATAEILNNDFNTINALNYANAANQGIDGDKGTGKGKAVDGISSAIQSEVVVKKFIVAYEKAKNHLASLVGDNNGNNLKNGPLANALGNDPIMKAIASGQAPSDPTPKQIGNFFYLIFQFLKDHKDSDSKLEVAQAVSMLSKEVMLDAVTQESVGSLNKMKLDIEKAKEAENSPLAKFLSIGLPILLAVVDVAIMIGTAGAGAAAVAAESVAVGAAAEAGAEAGGAAAAEAGAEAGGAAATETASTGAAAAGSTAAGVATDVAGTATETVATGATETSGEAAIQGAKNALKKIVQEAIKDGAKQGAEEAAKSGVKVAVREGAEEGAKEGVGTTIKNTLKSLFTISKGATKEELKEAVTTAVEKSVTKALTEGAGKAATEGAVRQFGKEAVETAVKQIGKEAGQAMTKTASQCIAQGVKRAAGWIAGEAMVGGGLIAATIPTVTNKLTSDYNSAVTDATQLEQGETTVNSAASASLQNDIKEAENDEQNEQGNQQADASLTQQVIQTMTAVNSAGKN